MSFSEWKEYKLEDVTINYNSKRIPLSSKERELRQGKYPYYGAQGVIDFIDKFIFEGQYLLVAEDGANLETRNEDIARLTKNQEQFWVNNHAHILRSNENSDIRFIKYFLNKSDLSGYITGSAQPKLNKANLNSIRMVLPPFEEQKAIARILSTLDEKIEVNNQINKTLENMAQAIFKQWFVDFEFPNEDGEPYKSSGGEMVESEFGMIPKGWEVKKSSDIANINIGKTPPRKEKKCFTLDPDDYKWISIKDLGNSGAYIFDSSEYLTKESIEKYNVKVVPDNTVVLSFKLTIGRVSITCGQMTTNEAIAHFNLNSKSKITTEYLYLYLKSFDYGKLGNTSSIANAVNSKIIKAMPVIVPDNKTIKTFNEVMGSVFSKIKYTIKQSDKLIEIRDSLLPKLMSGEIRVPLNEEGDAS